MCWGLTVLLVESRILPLFLQGAGALKSLVVLGLALLAFLFFVVGCSAEWLGGFVAEPDNAGCPGRRKAAQPTTGYAAKSATESTAK